MSPNWENINKCSLWGILGVTECENCDTKAKCWGEESKSPARKLLLFYAILGAIARRGCEAK